MAGTMCEVAAEQQHDEPTCQESMLVVFVVWSSKRIVQLRGNVATSVHQSQNQNRQHCVTDVYRIKAHGSVDFCDVLIFVSMMATT